MNKINSMDHVVVFVFGCLFVYVKRNEKNKSSINEIKEIGAFSLFFLLIFITTFCVLFFAGRTFDGHKLAHQ